MRPITAMSIESYASLKGLFRRGLLFVLLLAVALGRLSFAPATVAQAADNPLKVSMGLSQTSFTGPKEINVTIKITNASDGDMPGAVTLLYPNGDAVPDFAPTLGVGVSETWKGKWKVTQTQIDRGKVTFGVKYSIYDDNDQLVSQTKYYSKTITRDTSGGSSSAGASADDGGGAGAASDGDVTVTRTISHTTAGKGTAITIGYEVANNRTSDITGVVIDENKSVSNRNGNVGTVKAGTKKTYTFRVTMGTKDITSESTISYKSGGKTHKITQPAEKIKYAAIYLNATLKADRKGGVIGSTIKLTFTMKNTGTTPITGITVTDPLLGEVASYESLDGGKTVTEEREITIGASADYMFTIRGTTKKGDPLEVSTGRVSVTALDPASTVQLEIDLASDREEVYEFPGAVKFTATVTNSGSTEAKKVSVVSGEHTLHRFDTIPAGESRTFTREVAVSMAGSYQFIARANNQLNEVENFPSNIVHISYAMPTPVPTEAPIVTPPAPQLEEIPTDDGLPPFYDTIQGALGVMGWLFSVVAALLGLFILFVLVMRYRTKQERLNAVDHLEGTSIRDYSRPQRQPVAPAQPVSRPIGEEPTEAEYAPLPDEDIPDDTEDLMAETLSRLNRRPGVQDIALEDEGDTPAYLDDGLLDNDPQEIYEAAAADGAADASAYDEDAADDPLEQAASYAEQGVPAEPISPYARPGTASAADFSKTRRAYRRTQQSGEGEG